MKSWQKILTLMTAAAALGFILCSWIGAGLFIAPQTSPVSWPSRLSPPPEDVAFAATDGTRLRGWFLAQTNSTRAIVLVHGVSANRCQMLDQALWLRELGYNVLLYDARGCGESAPVARSFGWRETRDLLGAVSWLQERGVTAIGCLGFSQGAATILLASGQLSPAVHAVVAEAPYVTLQAAVDSHFRHDAGLPALWWGALIVPFAEWKLGMNIDDVSPLKEISKLKAPLYLIGGTSDTTAPPAGILQLDQAASGEKYLWMIPGAGHGGFFRNPEYKSRVGDFLKKYL